MKKLPFIVAGGLAFGYGLAVSGMNNPDVVISFLTLHDLGLLLVMAGGIAVTALAYHVVPRLMKRSITGDPFQKHDTRLHHREYLGAAIFGIGWGLSGLCPGAALAGLGTGNQSIAIGVLGIFLGAYLHGLYASRSQSTKNN